MNRTGTVSRFTGIEVLAPGRHRLSAKTASREPLVLPAGPELWRLYQQPAGTEHALVEFYLPLVRSILNRLAGTLPENIDREDLQSAGLLGLMEALRKFNPAAGEPFDSYVRRRIRGAMLDEMRRMAGMPRVIHQKSKKVQKILSRLEQRLGRAPTLVETAGAMKITTAQCEELFDEIRPVQFIGLDSVNEAGREEESFLFEVITNPDQIDPLEQASTLELKQVIFERLKELPEIQRKVLTLYFVEGLYLREIAERLGLTEGRICQIQTQAISSIRAYLKRYENGMTGGRNTSVPAKRASSRAKPVHALNDARLGHSRVCPVPENSGVAFSGRRML